MLWGFSFTWSLVVDCVNVHTRHWEAVWAHLDNCDNSRVVAFSKRPHFQQVSHTADWGKYGEWLWIFNARQCLQRGPDRIHLCLSILFWKIRTERTQYLSICSSTFPMQAPHQTACPIDHGSKTSFVIPHIHKKPMVARVGGGWILKALICWPIS